MESWRIKAYLYNDPDFIAFDKRGHQMYSVGFNKYYKFVNGNGFANIHQQIEFLDTKIPVAQEQISSIQTWKRYMIIKLQSIESAGYQCEVNPTHNTFTSKNIGHSYMSGDYVNPRKCETVLRNKATRRRNFNKAVWRYNPLKNTYSKKYKGKYITIMQSRYGNWGVFFANQRVWDFDGQKMHTMEEAERVAFEIFEEYHTTQEERDFQFYMSQLRMRQ